ncbi:MAG TPA: DUF3568 family protein [Opitutus sp.]|nr:DUF3568 family protein [Opitutus sp.]
MQKKKWNHGRWCFALFGAVLALAAAGATSGCLAVAAGAGAGAAVAYVRGELKATVSADYEPTVTAANRALQDLQFAKVSEKHDAIEDTIVARTAADKKVEIHIEQLTREATTVKIRVGLLGDEATSIAVLDKIKSRL